MNPSPGSRTAAIRSPWRPRILRGLLLLVTLLAMMLSDAMVLADSYDDRRVRAGARLFRSLLAADVALERKTAGDGTLHVIILGSDRQLAGELGELIVPPEDAEKARIRGLVVHVETRDSLPDNEVPAGVFLATPPPAADIDRLVRWSIDHHVILYSPFEGHVERGVTAGIAIEAKVHPYVNARTLHAAGIELKPFFLKVAKVHP